jgi:hypothetical protein
MWICRVWGMQSVCICRGDPFIPKRLSQLRSYELMTSRSIPEGPDKDTSHDNGDWPCGRKISRGDPLWIVFLSIWFLPQPHGPHHNETWILRTMVDVNQKIQKESRIVRVSYSHRCNIISLESWSLDTSTRTRQDGEISQEVQQHPAAKMLAGFMTQCREVKILRIS